MKTETLKLGGLNLQPFGWDDISDELEGDEKPFTLAKGSEDSGALQFSPALYRGGPLPMPSEADLLRMAQAFGEQRELGDPFGETTESGDLSLAGVSFRLGEDFVRVWYASDGRSIALITYVTAWGNQGAYLPECERIVRTVRFS